MARSANIKGRLAAIEERMPDQQQQARICWVAVINGQPAKVGYDRYGRHEAYYGFDPAEVV